MDVEYMRPFVLETIRTLEVMLGVTPTESDIKSKQDTDATYDVSAIVGLTGSATGSVVLSFPEKAACAVVSRMLGEKQDEINTFVTDGLGELVNIIAGNAKRHLAGHGFDRLFLSLPNVVIGKHRTVWHSRDMPYLIAHFTSSELGPFCLEVNIRKSEEATG